MPVLLDKSNDPILIEKFIFIGSEKLETYLDVQKNQRQRLKSELPEGLYWFQYGNKGGKLFWNWHLVRDYLLNGGDRTTEQHQKLVEEFLQTLPGNQSA